MKHAFLPPSGAHTWSKCALWPTMNAQFPKDDSPESIEGTAAHWVAWEMLAGRPVAEGKATDAGTIITGEMLDGAELLVDTIHARGMSADYLHIPLHIEETVDIPLIGDDCFGTPDAWTFDLGRGYINIVDYKFGHRFVDEYFNPQGLLYLAGILGKIKLIGDPNYLSVGFTIVQPRCFYKGAPVRTHTFGVREAHEHLVRLQLAADAARDLEPTATTNPHCGDCPGRHACPTLQQAAYSDAEYSSDSQPHTLSPSAAALELRMLERAHERLGARVDGLRELTLSNLKGGARIPYYSLAEGKGRRTWSLPTEQVISIGQLLGKDLAKPSVITPAQAIKLGLDESIVSANSFVPAGSLKLVAENPADVRKVFGK